MTQFLGASHAAADVEFMARLLALAHQPRQPVQNTHVNGPYKLVIVAWADSKLPYGILPRLHLA